MGVVKYVSGTGASPQTKTSLDEFIREYALIESFPKS